MKRVAAIWAVAAMLIAGAGCKRLATPPGGDTTLPGTTNPSTPPNTPTVTNRNFHTLTMRTSGGITNLETELIVRDGTLIWTEDDRMSKPKTRTTTLSNMEFDVLVDVLNEARFPSLVGKYMQKNLADGINETVTLSLRGADGRPQQWFDVENYGDTAPAAYYKVTEYLRQLLQRKFSKGV